MAEDKKSFILYSDLINTVSKLPDQEAGKLFKIILEYVNDKNPDVEDLLLQIAFEPIKNQLKRDLRKYEGTISRKSEGGKKGMETRWGKKDNILISKDKIVKDYISSITDNDNVNVTDNVNDTVTEIKKGAFPKISNLIFPFDSENFKMIWEAWVNFRKEIRKPYQTFSSQQAHLQQLTKFDEPTAIAMIKQSMANDWKDIYKLKEDGKTGNSRNEKQSNLQSLVAELRKSDQ